MLHAVCHGRNVSAMQLHHLLPPQVRVLVHVRGGGGGSSSEEGHMHKGTGACRADDVVSFHCCVSSAVETALRPMQCPGPASHRGESGGGAGELAPALPLPPRASFRALPWHRTDRLNHSTVRRPFTALPSLGQSQPLSPRQPAGSQKRSAGSLQGETMHAYACAMMAWLLPPSPSSPPPLPLLTSSPLLLFADLSSQRMPSSVAKFFSRLGSLLTSCLHSTVTHCPAKAHYPNGRC